LEEFVEKLAEYDVNTQTDAFLDRPPTPLFIPQKSGPDAGTQVYLSTAQLYLTFS
jgi:hypothetical protein